MKLVFFNLEKLSISFQNAANTSSIEYTKTWLVLRVHQRVAFSHFNAVQKHNACIYLRPGKRELVQLATKHFFVGYCVLNIVVRDHH